MTERESFEKGDRVEGKKRRDRLGQQLRQIYDDVASEPVPDDFLKLLDDADDQSDNVEGQS